MKALGHGANVAQMAAHYNRPIEEIIDFSSNINPFVSDHIEDLLPTLLKNAQNYPDIEYTALREAIASYLKCHKEEIIVGNGATEIMYLLMKALCHLGPSQFTLGILHPTFSEYERSARLNGMKIVDFYLKEEKGFEVDLKEIEENLDSIDALFICNPNNPTGNVQELTQLLELLKAQEKWLIVDETFMEFVAENASYSLVPFIKDYDKLMVIQAITKFYGLPGIRLGYGITAHEGLKEAMYEYKEPWTVNSFAEQLTEHLLKDKAYQEKSRAYFKAERRRMMETLEAIKGLTVYPASANFILLNLQEHTADEVKEKLFEESGLLIRDASNFKGLDAHYIRVAVKKQEENDQLVAALKKCLDKINV